MSVAHGAQWRLDGRVKTEAESKDEGAHTHGFNVSRGGVLEVGGSALLGGSVRVLGELVVQTEGDATFKLLCLGEAGQVRLDGTLRIAGATTLACGVRGDGGLAVALGGRCDLRHTVRGRFTAA